MTEPTEPRTHHTTVERITVEGTSQIAASLPDGWEPGTPVVVSTVPPDGVAVAADGRMVLLPGAPLPVGWERRLNPDIHGDAWVSEDGWSEQDLQRSADRRTTPIEVRPVPAPEPAPHCTVCGTAHHGDRDGQCAERWYPEDVPGFGAENDAP